MKAVLRGKFVALSASKKRMERVYTNSLTVHLKALEQKGANTPKMNRRQEIIKHRAKINQIEAKRTLQRINKIRGWFFEKNQQYRLTLSQTKVRAQKHYPN